MDPTQYSDLQIWGLPLAAALGGLVLGYLVRRGVLPRLARLTARSSWKFDDILVESIRGPVVIWGMLIGLRLAIRLLPLSSETEDTIATVVMVFGILSVSWAVARFAAAALRSGAPAGAFRGVSLLANVVRALVFAIGILIILQMLGISITPIITALGIGGLAVGLALQDTLANFFAGLRILAAGTIHVGDYVMLESGQEGYVRDIAWAQTTVSHPAGNIILVPNAKLSSAITVNYQRPEAPQVFVVDVGVSYDSDLDHVERVALEVATDVQQTVPEAHAGFVPTLRYKQFGESSVNFMMVLKARSYPDRWAVIHEFLKRLHKRFGTEGIEIPYPVRAIRMMPPEPGALPPAGSDPRRGLPRQD